jgi:hypothetical protein
VQEHGDGDDVLKNIVPDAVLLEVGNRDLWQLKLISRDQVPCGRIVRQLVEPKMYTIRYLIAYDVRTGRRIPVPANAVTEITREAVFCNIDALKFLSLPQLAEPLDRVQEEEIHAVLEQTPYWVEEAAFMGEGPEPGNPD